MPSCLHGADRSEFEPIDASVLPIVGKPIETKPKTASEMAADLATYGGRKSGIVIMTNGDNFLPFREKLKLDLEFFTQFAAWSEARPALRG